VTPESTRTICDAAARLLRHDADTRIVTTLAHFCHSLARAITQRYYARQLSHFSLASYDASSFAWRCIEELFLPRNDMPCHELVVALSSQWDANTGDAVSLFGVLRAVVSRKIAQTVPDIYAEIDPVFGRILRSVTRFVRGSAEFSLSHSMVGLIVHHQHEAGLTLPTAQTHPDELAVVLQTAHAETPVPALVRHLLGGNDGEPIRYRSVPLIVLAAAIRDFYAQFRPPAEDDNPDLRDTSLRETAQRIAHSVAMRLRSDILETYVRHGKLTIEYADRLHRLLCRALTDLAHGENGYAYDYFAIEFPEFPHSVYRTQWRARVEYLLRLGRREWLALLRLHVE
jgi:hypothetical protein